MNDDLVTAGVFGDQTQAVVVQNHLKEAGIPAFLLDEYMSQGLFVVGGAAGGVRIQVPKSRLEEAVRLINDRLPGQSDPVDWSDVDVGQPESADEDPEDAVKPAAGLSPPQPPYEPVEPTDLNVREDRANRLVRGALIGLFAWPVFFFALFRMIQVASSSEAIRPEYQRKANLAAFILLSPFLLAAAVIGIVWLSKLMGS